MTMIKKVEREDGTKHQVYGYRRGRKVYVGTFETNRLALEAEEDFNSNTRRIERGELGAEHDEKRALGPSLELWLAMLKATGSRSRVAYGEFVAALITPHLGGRMLAALSRKEIEDWRTKLIGKVAATSINAAITTLSSACRWFVEQHWIGDNPCRGVKRLPKPPRSYLWIRTRAEFERVLSNLGGEFRDMAAVAVGTMLRIDEMLHLQWDDVDLENRLITVQRGRKGPPKNGRIRHVPILDSVLPVLKAKALKRDGATLVFPGAVRPNGKHGVRSTQPIGKAFKRALVKAGLDPKIRWHDLRHTGASWWVMGGGDIFRLSKLLGHSDVKITRDTYAHLAPEAWQQDYGRVGFRMPSEGRVIVLSVDARKTSTSGDAIHA
jgi:integrase